jgi:hypothetical protein
MRNDFFILNGIEDRFTELGHNGKGEKIVALSREQKNVFWLD